MTHAATLDTLAAALFYDLSTEKRVRFPGAGERDRALRELVFRHRKPVVLLIDDAHDLNGRTLAELRRLVEFIGEGQGRLSVVLAGQPALCNALQPMPKASGDDRTDVFTLEGITAGDQREYIGWLLQTCSIDQARTAQDMLTEEAIDMLASRLHTPLQIQHDLSRALAAGYQIGERPVSAEVVASVLSCQIDEPP